MNEKADFSGVTHYTHVDVQPGGINIQHVEHLYQADLLKQQGMEAKTEAETEAVDSCFFIHPSIDDDKARQILEELKRLVARQGIQEICKYLSQLNSEKKVLLPQNAEKAYNELVRLGMPEGEGYSLKTFMKYYKR